MENPLKKLFSPNAKNKVISQPVSNDNAMRKDGETYKQYGFRMAGMTAGNELSLPPNLQAIYWSLRKQQEEDENLQNELKLRLSKEKTNLEAEQEQAENDKMGSLNKQEALKQEIAEKQDELSSLKQEAYRRNRKAWTALIISGIILVPFTLYFFIFYSSVAYSAFYKEFELGNLSDGGFKISEAIFDARALSAAWNDGFTELLFILLMPIIFLAFGFILNRWENEKGGMKYVKIPLIILVAFVFDVLLSYEICEKIYNITMLMSEQDLPPYNASIAAQDPRFWVIICLGFVSYLIWGITFGYFVKAVDELDLNNILEQNLKEKIDVLKKQRGEECANCNNIAKRIISLQARIRTLDLQIDDSARYDRGRIGLELNNFFAGWQQYLASLGKPEEIRQRANDIFHDTLKHLKLEQVESL